MRALFPKTSEKNFICWLFLKQVLVFSPVLDVFSGSSCQSLKFIIQWQIDFRRNLSDWELEDFYQILQQVNSVQINQSQVDSLIWTASKDKLFSVKSCYSMLLEELGHWDDIWHWKMIWKTKAPVKVACLGRTAAQRACLTQNNLQKRVFSLCNRCYLCEEDQETVDHLFLHCKFSKHCWEFFSEHVWYLIGND